MSNFYNCNFKCGDIIIGINSEHKFSYLKIFIIKEIKFHEEYGRKWADHAVLEYTISSDICTDINDYEVPIKYLNQNYKRIIVESV